MAQVIPAVAHDFFTRPDSFKAVKFAIPFSACTVVPVIVPEVPVLISAVT